MPERILAYSSLEEPSHWEPMKLALKNSEHPWHYVVPGRLALLGLISRVTERKFIYSETSLMEGPTRYSTAEEQEFRPSLLSS